ncbi:hypothetical protein RGQ13_16555 [Thalassotalea psychrophila]|uniref:Anti-sigma factor n=1 Tax=Thalassotalea psychrophila TaxID=3065647 RepID=A0ABY9TSK6_9GAMM|nr:hypothetical protein RGQ13_16555 [Colwelliaceae bacterium SQ149]
MNKPISDQQLQTQIDNLAKDIKPERDLWAGIEHAIEHNSQQVSAPKKPHFAPYAWAASVALAVLLTWNINTNTSVQVAEVSAIDVIQQQYSQEKNSMLVTFGEPDLKELPVEIQSQFNELDSARKSLINALADDPNNADLLNLLKWTQQQELNLIEQLYSPQWQTI